MSNLHDKFRHGRVPSLFSLSLEKFKPTLHRFAESDDAPEGIPSAVLARELAMWADDGGRSIGDLLPIKAAART